MPTLAHPDYNINYLLEGPADAPLLVLSNSLGADLSMWDAQAAEFSKRYRVLRYDNRGHGGSTQSPGPYRIDDVANDAVLLIEHVGAKSAHFCGLSLGGMVGMWLATHKPELIQKLVLCNTSALMGPKEFWDNRMTAVRGRGMQAVVQPVIERWFTEAFRAKHPEVVARIESSMLKVSLEGYVGCCSAIRDMDQRKAISAIKATTMVIAGTFDPSTPPAMGQAIAEAIKGARYVELPTAHLSCVEAASSFNDVVNFFLNA
jgi:3-oxoadipate enol-lactonase